MDPDQLAFLRRTAPRIPRLTTAQRRPFWTVIVPTHRRNHFLPQTLGSILAQDPGPERMQIEVMDDDPNSDTRALVRELGRDRIGYTRQPRNVGLFRNANDGIRRARGEWLHILHDDDWTLPGFYAVLEEALAQPRDRFPGAALTTIVVCDEEGRQRVTLPAERADPGLLDDWLVKTATTARVQPPAMVVRRDVYETLGGYHPGLPIAGDWEMFQRIAAHYDWWYEPRATACYREHSVSITGDTKASGRNVSDARAVIEFAQNYLPKALAPTLRRDALRYWAAFAYGTARRMILAGDYQGAANQLIEALRTDPSAPLVNAVITMGNSLKTG